MTQATAIRRRTRAAAVPQTLPPAVVNYIQEHFQDGQMPVDAPVAVLAMMERLFSTKAYKEHRHHVLDRMFRGGMSVAQIAVLFDRSERTVENWKREMREYFGQGFSLKTVREIHEETMLDFDVQMRLCDEVIMDPSCSVRERVSMMRTKQRWYAIKEQVKRNAGFYEVFDVSKLQQSQNERVTEAEEFLAGLDRALLGGHETFEVRGLERERVGDD